MPVPDNEASPQPLPNKWGPYANAGDFTAHVVITLVVLFCGLLSGLAVNVAIRFLCARRHRGLNDDPEKQAREDKKESTLPTLVFSVGIKLAGAEEECAICLADFVEGDKIRVLPSCNHGFHVQCVDLWLASRPSCPKCRVSCLVTSSQG